MLSLATSLRLAFVLLALLAGGTRASWAAPEEGESTYWAPQIDGRRTIHSGPSAPSPSSAEIEALVASIRPRIESQFHAIESRLNGSRELGCDDLRALRLRGRYAECAQLADRCESTYTSRSSARGSLSDIEQEGLREVLGEGALCLVEQGKYKDARRWFDAAVPLLRGHGRPYVSLMHALTLVEMAEEQAAVETLRPLTSESGEAFELLQMMHPPGWATRPAAEQDARLKHWLAAFDPTETRFFGQLWLGRITSMLDVEAHPIEALRALSERIEVIDDPYASVRIAYQSLFSLGMLAQARSLYDAYLPRAHADAWLPVEANTFTYAQLRAACPGALLEGDAARRLQAIAQAWTLGHKDRVESLAQAMQLQREFPSHADVDTLIGSLVQALGRDALAQVAYWNAHTACPYYDRAHWGLLTLKRTRKSSLPRASDTLQRSDKLVEKAGVPRAISTYVSNWASLNSREQKQLLGAIRPWIPHVGSLVDAGYRLYAKRGFERVSDIAGLSSYRDLRVGSADGSDDQRLWDDIRGLNAPEQKLVVVDVTDTVAALLGGQNLAGHEVAHQFHRMLSTRDRVVTDCILRLYQGARAKAAFVTPVAATDEYEYFAESATAWLQDAPNWHMATARGRVWLEGYDPRIARAIDQIASGNLSAFRCPE